MLVQDSVVARRFADANDLLVALDHVYRGIDQHTKPSAQAIHPVWDSTGPDGTGYPSGTRSATTPPHGNPPAQYEVAQAFQFVDGPTDGRLVELAILVRNYHPTMKAVLRLLDNGEAGPDETKVLWSGPPSAGEPTRLVVRPSGGIPLRLGETYWVCLSVDAPGTNLPWITGWDGWRGTKQIFPGVGLRNLLAERADGQPWRVTEPSGAGMSLQVQVALDALRDELS
jgi:hypothetical protein